MKKLFILLFVLLTGLCACGPTTPPEGTTTVAPPKVEIKTDKNDPYSYVVKEDYDSLYDGLFDVGPRYFDLYDLDGDGINELLLGENTGEWGSRDGEITLYTVYAIKNNEAVLQEPAMLWDVFGPNPPTVLLKNGMIRMIDTRGGEGAESTYYYRFEGGQLKLQIDLVNAWGDYYQAYDIDRVGLGTPITKAEYDRVKAEMEGDGQVVEIDWKPLAEYGRPSEED